MTLVEQSHAYLPNSEGDPIEVNSAVNGERGWSGNAAGHGGVRKKADDMAQGITSGINFAP